MFAKFKNKHMLDLLFLTLSQLLNAFLSFIIQIILVRVVSVEAYGALSTVLRLNTLFSTLIVFGVGRFWLRIFASEGVNAFRWVKPTLFLTILSTFMTVLLYIITICFVENNLTITIGFIMISALIAQGTTDLALSVLQLESNYKVISILQVLNNGLRFLVVIIGSIISFDIYGIAIGFSMAALLLIVIQIPIIVRMFSENLFIKEKSIASEVSFVDSPDFKQTVVGTWPYAVGGFFFLVYYQVDILLLNIINGEMSAAYYNVAFTVLSFLYLFPNVLYQKFLLPKIHRWSVSSPGKIQTLNNLGTKCVAIIGSIFMIIVVATSNTLIPLTFGKQYEVSASILMIMSLSLPFRLMGNNYGSLLVTRENMVKKAKYQGVGAVLNLTLNLLLIPYITVFGAAISTVITEGLITLLFYRGVNKYIFKSAIRYKLNFNFFQFYLYIYMLVLVSFIFYILSLYKENIYIFIYTFITIVILIKPAKVIFREYILIKG
ncbi:oligosaccharide flippase family protein [Pontibacillus salicampi]|uniref:Oligosaccharide flippase family protein n=1 Tax=Pontibacillus salicampi TaxID=1449801 RepID=A0ABV6LST2_9BACI